MSAVGLNEMGKFSLIHLIKIQSRLLKGIQDKKCFIISDWLIHHYFATDLNRDSLKIICKKE